MILYVKISILSLQAAFQSRTDTCALLSRIGKPNKNETMQTAKFSHAQEFKEDIADEFKETVDVKRLDRKGYC